MPFPPQGEETVSGDGGVPSVPEGQGKKVTNLYVIDGKLKVEYEE